MYRGSTYKDLQQERCDVYEAIIKLGHIPVGMEYFGSRSKDSIAVIEEFIKDCDFQITIVGTRYGSIIPGDTRSYSEMEYDFANASGVPQIAFLKKLNGSFVTQDDGIQKNSTRLRQFRNKVQNNQVTFWETRYDLIANILSSLNKVFEENDRPGWTKGDQANEWVVRQLSLKNNELEGVKMAIQKYRLNTFENNRKLFDQNILPSPKITGVWGCQIEALTIEFFEYAGTIMSFAESGTHEHWIFGLWRPERKEIQTQVWRRELIPSIDGEKRLTMMFGRIFNIQDDSFESEIFASDGQADLNYNFSEHLTWKRIITKK
jgi:hypothetical protein